MCSSHHRTPARPRCPPPAVRTGTFCRRCRPGPCKQCPRLHRRRRRHPYSPSGARQCQPTQPPWTDRRRSWRGRRSSRRKRSCSRRFCCHPRSPRQSPASHSLGEGCPGAHSWSGSVWRGRRQPPVQTPTGCRRWWTLPGYRWPPLPPRSWTPSWCWGRTRLEIPQRQKV